MQDGVLQLQCISTDEKVIDIWKQSIPNKKLVYLRLHDCEGTYPGLCQGYFECPLLLYSGIKFWLPLK